MTRETLKDWAEAEPEAVRKTMNVIGSDGHTIYDPAAFKDIPKALLPVRTLQSAEGHGKETIYVRGERVDELEGVYGLSLSGQIAGALGLEPGNYMGRGFQARANFEAIDAWLKERGC